MLKTSAVQNIGTPQQTAYPSGFVTQQECMYVHITDASMCVNSMHLCNMIFLK